jgi:hypothetical protein
MPIDGRRSGDEVRAGALEPGGPRSRGRLALERGPSGPRPRGRPPCRPGGLQGLPGLRSCRARVLGSWFSLCFAFFVGFKRVVPDGSPRASVGAPVRVL